jgi:hypothetical protein
MSKHNAQNKSHHLPKAILTTTKTHICRFATSLQHVIFKMGMYNTDGQTIFRAFLILKKIKHDSH